MTEERGSPDVVDYPVPAGWDSRALVVVGLVAVVTVAVVGWLVYSGRETAEDRYLAELEEEGLDDRFAADRAAVRHAEDLCDRLDTGDPPQGDEVDLIAVSHYCDDYEAAFKVVETVQVKGTFTLRDYESATNGCRSSLGYGDVREGMPITVETPEGDLLATAYLGRPKVDGFTCVYRFDMELTEGEETYVFVLGEDAQRGTVPLTWDEASAGPALTLG